MVKLEIQKITKRNSYKFVAILYILVSVIDALTNMYSYYGKGLSEVYPAYTMSVLNNVSRSPFRIIYVVMLPIVVSAIASDMYTYDRDNKINNIIFVRVNKAKYIWSQAAAIFISVSSLILFSLLLNLIICLVAFPAYGNMMYDMWLPGYLVHIQKPEYIEYELFGVFRFSHPYLNLLFFIFMRSIIAGVFAVLSYAVAAAIKINRYVVFVISFFIFNIVEFGESIAEQLLLKAQETNLVKIVYSGLLELNPMGNIVTYFKDIILYLLLAVITTYIGTRKEEL